MVGAKPYTHVATKDCKAVAFGECIVHGDTMYAEYLGLDYSVALQLHLYHYVFRDLVRWGMANGVQMVSEQRVKTMTPNSTFDIGSSPLICM